MNAPALITITPILVADLLVEGEPMPLYVHVIDHPDARVLVDTGMTELHPAVVDALDPRYPLSEQDVDLAGIDIVVNTHLHADHCGGNHLFAGKPIHVQRRELDEARTEDDYTIREWVDAPGVRYVPVDGELELLPGLRLVPAPGHSDGMQVVVVETGGRPVVVGGDVAVWHGEFDEPPTEGRRRVLALDPELVWLAHEHEPWRPRTVSGSTRALPESSSGMERKEGIVTRHVLFLQGAGSGAYDEDTRLADSLRRALGPRFEVHYPAIPNDGDVPFEQWRQWIERELAGVPGPVVIVGHSVGASVLLKWLSEREDERAIAGAFLVECPYWGGDGWRYEGYEELALPPGFAARLPPGMPVYLYHCRDDAIVPFDHLALYARAMPRATVRSFDEGGHQLNDDLSAVARDIESLPS